jgi:predicted regulator of Ras-like GTPase activity (Roadblock/LC7/MglB family)
VPVLALDGAVIAAAASNGRRRKRTPYASASMDAKQALADLTEISSQIQAAVVFDDTGKVAGSTIEDGARADALAGAAIRLLEAAADVKGGGGGSPLTQLEVATGEGSVFVVREGKSAIAATTGSNPTVGLVFYDLKSTLRNVKTAPARKPAASRKTGTAAKKKTAAAAKKTSAARKPSTRKKPDAP